MDKREVLKEKIVRECNEILHADEFEKAKKCYILGTIKQAFQERDICVPKETVEYLLDNNINAIEELAKRISELENVDFYAENVQTAIEEIQIEQEA